MEEIRVRRPGCAPRRPARHRPQQAAVHPGRDQQHRHHAPPGRGAAGGPLRPGRRQGQELVLAAAAGVEGVSTDPAPRLLTQDLGQDARSLRLTFWVDSRSDDRAGSAASCWTRWSSAWGVRGGLPPEWDGLRRRVRAQPPQPGQVMDVVGEQDLDHAQVGDAVQQVADAALLGRGQRLQAVVQLQQVGQQAAVGPVVGQAAPRAAAGTRGPAPPGGCGSRPARPAACGRRPGARRSRRLAQRAAPSSPPPRTPCSGA